MNIDRLERLVRRLVDSHPGRPLAALAGDPEVRGMLDRETAEALDSMAARAGNPGKADDPEPWL